MEMGGQYTLNTLNPAISQGIRPTKHEKGLTSLKKESGTGIQKEVIGLASLNLASSNQQSKQSS